MWQLYEVTSPSGSISTVKASSPIGAVAGFSNAPRHNWTKTDNGLEVTARRGDGTEIAKFNVKQSCFENLPPRYPLV